LRRRCTDPAPVVVAVLVTPVLRVLNVPDGVDVTRIEDYVADEGDRTVRRMTEILDGTPSDETIPPTFAAPHSAAHRSAAIREHD
jgi:SSS family solute:Na+ symporter